MSKAHKHAYFGDQIVPIEKANISVASSAVLYGLSVYTVFPVIINKNKTFAFRLQEHFERLINSANIVGINTFSENWNFEKFKKAVKDLVTANNLKENFFIRATVHVTELVPGTRSRNMETTLSMFAYEANPIIPQNGARLKTSVWRRVTDYAIPSRAKINGSYVNSVLGKQEALDCGYDDCLFLDSNGRVCELSAANIFIIRDGVLITPNQSSDILEGINRKTVLEIAGKIKIPVVERTIDLTEMYIADEVFACGTSSYIAPIIEIDARKINNGKAGVITQKIKKAYTEIFQLKNPKYKKYLTLLK